MPKKRQSDRALAPEEQNRKMAKQDRIKARQLAELDTEFRALLIPCLQQCAGGRWGLFGAYDRFPEIKQWLNWPQAERLRELAVSIRSMLVESGRQSELVEEFLRRCTFHGPNDPGEPKLAEALLEKYRELRHGG